MRIEPLSLNGKIRTPLQLEDVTDTDVYEEFWLPAGDDKEMDLFHLLKQGRIHKS